MARLDPVRRHPGALQPAAARHRARAAPDGRGPRHNVAAWSPLAGGILSGKFTRPRGLDPGTRIDPASISEHQRNVATTLQSVADDVGARPSQVAIAGTRKRSPAIHPVIGARRLSQLLDNLGASGVGRPDAAAARLDAAAGIDLGFH